MYEPRAADSDVNEAGRRIEEGYIRLTGKRPLVADLAGIDCNFDHSGIIAGDERNTVVLKAAVK